MDWVTLRTAAEALGVTPDALRMAIKRKRLTATKLGRDWVISTDELDRQLELRGKPPWGQR